MHALYLSTQESEEVRTGPCTSTSGSGAAACATRKITRVWQWDHTGEADVGRTRARGPGRRGCAVGPQAVLR